MVMMVAGGNDAADLVGKFLNLKLHPATGLPTDPDADTAYKTFLGQQFDSTTIAGILSQNQGYALAAGAYMQQLANTYYGQIKSQVLDKGGKHVVVLNIPDITLTPRFGMVLAGVKAQSNEATSLMLKGAIQQWISAFNNQLKTNIGKDERVALVDFYADFTDEVVNFSNYALSNATDTTCPIVGADAQGLPKYDFLTCTSASLDALPGKTAGWWKSYAFSDGFHPTPFAHGLLAASVSRALARAGWL